MTAPAVLSTAIAPPVLDELCVNTLRFLAVDMVQKTNSGHPGFPLASATMAYTLTLWNRLPKFNPRDPPGQIATGLFCRPVMGLRAFR
jgi:hypothetical protein